MLTENINEAIKSLTEKPMFAVTVERVKILNEIKDKYNDKPQPIAFGMMLNEFLSRVSVPVEKFDLILGREIDRELTEEEEAEFQQYTRSPSNPKNRTMLGSGHCTYGWKYIVDNGLPGLIEKAEESMKIHTDPEEQIFLKGAILIYRAIQTYLLRYEESARSIGLTEAADACHDAALSKPYYFRQALQLVWTIGFVNNSYLNWNPTLDLGRMDQFLYKFYVEDIKSERITREFACDLITDFYCKNNLNMGRGEHQIGDATNSTTFDRIFNFDAPQYLPLAGSDENGNDAANELTELFVENIVPEFKNPVVLFRYTKGFAKKRPGIWRTLVFKQYKSAPIMVYNDSDVISALMYTGIPEKDARCYSHFGCNWGNLGENSNWMHDWPGSILFYPEMTEEEKQRHFNPRPAKKSGGYRNPLMIMQVIVDLYTETGEDLQLSEIVDGLFERFGKNLDGRYQYYDDEYNFRCKHPSRIIKYSDPFQVRSIERAKSNSASGSDYHFQPCSFAHIGSIVDSYLTVKELVYDKKLLTLGRLIEAVKNNFEGYDYEYALCKSVDKFGSNSDESNRIARTFVNRFVDMVREKNKYYLAKSGVLLNPSLQTDTGHIITGRAAGATFDGRKAGEAFSQNSSPAPGARKNGLTEMLNAMLNIPFDKITSAAFNLDINPKDYEGESGLSNLAGILESYFERGGLQVQISSVSVEDMKDAQIHPENHKDLRVRVTGYSGIFVDLCKTLQDDIIKRST